MNRAASALAGCLLAAGAVTATALPAAAQDEPGVQIIGGHDATENYSFMASLQVGGQHFCGGSLIKSNWVVTAAHCVTGKQPGFDVRIGSTDRTTGGTVAKATEVIVHPESDNGLQGADIALVKLDRNVEQQPIQIAAEFGQSRTETRILGWGIDCFDQKCEQLPRTLQELDTKLVPDRRCTEIDGPGELCTDSDTPDAMGCFGDSGGPQITGRPGDWELIGATSRDGDDDPRCATGPGIWTDVTTYSNWIEQNTGQ